MKIVIDTNIFIAAIIKPSMVRRLLVESSSKLLFPEAVLTELNEHQNEILKKSGLSQNDFEVVKSTLLKYVELVPTASIKPYSKEAFRIIGQIDPDDVPFIASCLAHNAILWSEDKDLKKQNKIKVLNTAEIKNLLT